MARYDTVALSRHRRSIDESRGRLLRRYCTGMVIRDGRFGANWGIPADYLVTPTRRSRAAYEPRASLIVIGSQLRYCRELISRSRLDRVSIARFGALGAILVLLTRSSLRNVQSRAISRFFISTREKSEYTCV